MDTKALFGQVSKAVSDALMTRRSKLDAVDYEGWTREMLAQDAAEVHSTVNEVCIAHGWTPSEFHAISRRIPSNRHHP